MAQSVSIKIKVDDNFKSVEVNAKDLGKAIDAVVGSSKELSTSIVKLGSISQIAEGAASAMGQLSSVIGELAGTYAAQSTAETRLSQAMANTMGATAEEVQAIKDLCSAQQQLGVIGDEVQLAAAQELATYLEYSDSLKSIIPVMNDMAAQQYGLGASAESVTQIATMLGKVMNGQTEALSRYGYKFDEAQKQILKYGTEAERAAVLVDVVSESVGGMNEALAQTPAGRMQQLANNIGDIKERIGAALQQAMPFVSTLNQVTQGVATVTRLVQAFKALNLEQARARVLAVAETAATKAQAAAKTLLTRAEQLATRATKALGVEMAALQATLTMGLSIAITAVIALITRLSSKSKEAADSVEEVDEASEAFAQTSKDARSQIALYQVQLQDIIKHHKNDAQAVKELNDKYGESFGYYQTAESWYKVLTEKSAAYCRQLGYEAKAKVLASQKADKELEQERVKNRLLQLQKEGKATQSKHIGTFEDANGKRRFGSYYRWDDKEYATLREQYSNLGKEIADIDGQFQTCTANMASAQEELQGGITDTSETISWQKMNLAQLTKAIQDQKGVVESYVGVDKKRADQENATLKQMEARKKALESTYRLGDSSSTQKHEFDGTKLIENAASYKELGNNIKYYQNALEKTNPAEVEAIGALTTKINELQAAQTKVKEFSDMLAGNLPDIDEIGKQIDADLDRMFDKIVDETEKGLEREWKQLMKKPTATGTLGLGMEMELTLATKVKGADFARQQVETLQNMLKYAEGDQKKAIQNSIKYWSQFSKELNNTQTSGEKFTGLLSNLSSITSSLSGVVDDNTAGWLTWSSNLLSAIASALPAIAQLIGGNIAQAFSGAIAQSQTLPPPFNLVMLAANVAAVGAAVAAIPKYADGGLAYGPTLGIFGEYAGASNNPEVVAPLDKLRDMIGPQDGGLGGKVEFEIRGDVIAGALKRYSRKMGRS